MALNSPTRIYDPLFATPEIAAVFSGRGQVEQMLRFEWALAVALEEACVIPVGVSKAIEAVTVDTLDLDEIALGAVNAGNLAIPFISSLKSYVLEHSPSLVEYIHWGATSQDVLDTAKVLQARETIRLLQIDLDGISDELVVLVQKHALTLLPGRTWLQHGPPVTWGLKLAGWLDALQRHRVRLKEASARCIVLQFGGAVGTLAALGELGPPVTRRLAHALDLPEPSMPWHTHRDRFAELATTLGLLAGTLGKIGRDFSLLMQTEIAEVLEPAGENRGTSSTMPHKRNPVYSSILLATAVRVPGLVSTMLSAMVQEHERGLGGWQAEWETLDELFRLTAGSLRAARHVVSDCAVNEDLMRQHLAAIGGVALSEAVSFALARKIGRSPAHRLLAQVTRAALDHRLTLREALLKSTEVCNQLSVEEIDLALDPGRYLGSTSTFIANVIAAEERG
ncbi:3-carboxy-cis,cis-muconate cycloisomerase [Tunturiibacter empetritectus]|uniref:3-carboxy-cis,cis-muconate cycloisomerase n=1 Tax=Tunturiibacter lichenicola TaxID=2051959 RepID=A0A852VIM5_9BACT|nr:3-carboxy-cis,cis-muconate cycloisomerase [Edaphobacter lichenicola]NYF91547.1 3-carboxy-cis,cis-muconate cycloisomerase [Edaphobacter lichenicola]